MRSKDKPPETKTRIRESQQRWRARHQKHIADVQRGLQQYEQDNKQATLNLQRAARAVALENDRLRALLACHGVLEDEVKRFLLSGDVTEISQRRSNHEYPSNDAYLNHHACLPDQPVYLARSQEPMSKSSEAQKTGTQLRPQSPKLSSLSSGSTASSGTGAMDGDRIANSPLDEFSMNHSDRQPLDESYGGDDGDLHSVSGNRTFPSGSVLDRRAAISTTNLEMQTSCNVAAMIIANMQGHGDTSQAFAALGCSEMEDCVVKTVQIFDLAS